MTLLTGTPAELEAGVGALDQAIGEVLVETTGEDAETEARKSLRSSSVNVSRKAPASDIKPPASHCAAGTRPPPCVRRGRCGVALLLVVEHLLVEGEALVVEDVAHLVALGPEVALVE